MREVEVKILDVDPEEIRKRLEQKGAKFLKKVFQRNILYQNSFTRKKNLTVRIREEEGKAIITVKGPMEVKNGHKIREEKEVSTGDLEEAKKLFRAIGLEQWAVTEAKREYYGLDNCSVEIIKIPKLPIFIEIEGSEKHIRKVAEKLGYSSDDYYAGSALDYYRELCGEDTSRLVFD